MPPTTTPIERGVIVADGLHADGDPANRVRAGSSAVPAAAPLVSCLMITRGRLRPARHAVACFLNQDYPQRELVVVVDDLACELVAYLQQLAVPTIRVLAAPTPGLPLGELRNLAVAAAQGEFVCQWDDDDLYAPERIRVQWEALLAAGADACLLGRWTVWWPATRRLGVSGRRLWEGSILARRQALPPYPALRRGEDTAMVEELVAQRRVLQLDAPELYVYIHHGANTFGSAHFRSIYNYTLRRWVGSAYDEEITRLAARLPLADYAADLQATTGPVSESVAHVAQRAAAVPPPFGEGDLPLVSIIVRSMGRAELREALESLAAQTYPRLEVIVVDATGGGHPPLPPLPWRAGHSARLVSGPARLSRPRAANVGLDAVEGDWFGFLDDDDTFDADHLSVLMEAGRGTDCPVVYGATRLIGADGEVSSVHGMPFNRALMFCGPLFCFPAALIRREVIGWGCRFDDDFEISEDRDFFAQIAAHADFRHVELATFNYRCELGTSGTGRGGNRQWCRSQRFEQRLRSRWYGPGQYHMQRALRLVRRSLAAYCSGDRETARRLLETCLDQYPGDPNALQGLGVLLAESGAAEAGTDLLRRAVQMVPEAVTFRLALAAQLERSGDRHGARREARAVTADPAADPATRAEAAAILSRVGPGPAAPAAAPADSPAAGTEPTRLSPCPCGSGKRYRDCCGALAHAVPQLGATDALAAQAVREFRAGNAALALGRLRALDTTRLASGQTALSCAELCIQMGADDLAYALLLRAEALGAPAAASAGVVALAEYERAAERLASLRATLAARLARLNAAPVAPRPMAAWHVIADLARADWVADHARALHALLAEDGAAHLWSVTPPPAGAGQPARWIDPGRGEFPRDGHLIFVGAHFEYGTWLADCQPARITLAVITEHVEALLERLVEIEDIPAGCAIDLTFSSAQLQGLTGLPGTVEYPLVDLERLRPAPVRREGPDGLVIGRPGRAGDEPFHPDDPALFRQLVRDGHRIHLLDGTALAPAMSVADRQRIVLVPDRGSGVDAFFGQVDSVLLRVPQRRLHTVGSTVLHAMAAALPVVLIGDRIGAAELIRHGETGFLAASEAEARTWLRRLAADPGLRATVGSATRQATVARQQRQAAQMRAYYR